MPVKLSDEKRKEIYNLRYNYADYGYKVPPSFARIGKIVGCSRDTASRIYYRMESDATGVGSWQPPHLPYKAPSGIIVKWPTRDGLHLSCETCSDRRECDRRIEFEPEYMLACESICEDDLHSRI